jgi:CRP/FNR family transcriptional regulator, cyclic AMP receptor protein
MFRQTYAQLEIFSGLENVQITQLSPYLVECHFAQGDIIFEQGQPAEHIYILISGEVVVNYKPYDGPPLTVARVSPGGVFGWSAALRREIFTSCAVAVKDSCVVRIRGANLHTLCEQHPETGLLFLNRLTDVIGERLKTTHTKIIKILSQGADEDETNIKRMAKNARE